MKGRFIEFLRADMLHCGYRICVLQVGIAPQKRAKTNILTPFFIDSHGIYLSKPLTLLQGMSRF